MLVIINLGAVFSIFDFKFFEQRVFSVPLSPLIILVFTIITRYKIILLENEMNTLNEINM